MLVNPDQVLLGLSFLLLSSEEFISPKEDLLGKRKQELKVNFLKHIPKLFEILSGNIIVIILCFEFFMYNSIYDLNNLLVF